MKEKDLYLEYPHNEPHIRKYITYQNKYSSRIRESDRVILEIIAGLILSRGIDPLQLLDIGCSTGNLLLHLRQAFPALDLTGGELSDLSIETCKKDPKLTDISFMKLDIRALATEKKYDFITTNAILYGFDELGFSESISSIASALNPEGYLIAFDFFHPWKQEVSIIEKTGNFPDGHPLHFRSYDLVKSTLKRNGFDDIQFKPFSIPIDLPRPEHGTDAVETFTVPTADGTKLLFRGAIAQPWCHLVAKKGTRLG